MGAPISFLRRSFPKRDYAKLFGISSCVRILLFQVAVTIFNQAIRVILNFFGELGLASLVSLTLIEVLIIFFETIGVVDFTYILLLVEVARVGRWRLRSDYLNCNEAVFDVRVLDALNIAVFNLGERHVLIVLVIVVLDQVVDELLRVHVCLLLLVELLVEKELVLLFLKCGREIFLGRLVEHAQKDALVLHLHTREEVCQLTL